MDNVDRQANYAAQPYHGKLTPAQRRRIKHKTYTTHEHAIGSHTPNVRDVQTHERLVDHCEICRTPPTLTSA
jgi:hypothetical protein